MFWVWQSGSLAVNKSGNAEHPRISECSSETQSRRRFTTSSQYHRCGSLPKQCHCPPAAVLVTDRPVVILIDPTIRLYRNSCLFSPSRVVIPTRVVAFRHCCHGRLELLGISRGGKMKVEQQCDHLRGPLKRDMVLVAPSSICSASLQPASPVCCRDGPRHTSRTVRGKTYICHCIEISPDGRLVMAHKS